MIRTASESQTTTLARFIRAMDGRRPVTITYLRADGTETVRTIEVYDVVTTKAGAIVLKAMDRETQQSRSFRLDRVRSMTVHHGMRFTVEHAESTAPLTVPSLRLAETTLADLDTAPLDTAGRIALLADQLAA